MSSLFQSEEEPIDHRDFHFLFVFLQKSLRRVTGWTATKRSSAVFLESTGPLWLLSSVTCTGETRLSSHDTFSRVIYLIQMFRIFSNSD